MPNIALKATISTGTWQNKVLHVVLAALAFGIPVLTFAIPQWQDITLGTLVFGLVQIIQSKVG